MNDKLERPAASRSLPAMTASLLRSIPVIVTVVLIIDTVLMNFLARYTILDLPWVAVNAAIFVSWIAFLLLDIITKHFGPEAANIVSIIAAATNFFCSVVCYVICLIVKNPTLDALIGGQWSVFTASTLAFVISAVVNNYINAFIGKLFVKKPDGKTAYATRAFLSTFVSQFVDNFLFLFFAFFIFPFLPSALQVRWTMPQILVYALLCAIIELISEVIFAPIGYAVSKKWKEQNVGSEFIEKYYPKEAVQE